MPGPVYVPQPLPWWADPNKASVTDTWQGPIRKVVSLLGLDDPESAILALAAPVDAGKMGGGMLDAVAEKFPRLARTIRAFHGSPHEFDQFSTAKIGTGEGAQAFGHGLYFSGNEATADYYRHALSNTDVIVGGQARAVPRWGTQLSPEDRLIRRIADQRALQPTAPEADILDSVRASLDHELQTNRFGHWPSDAELEHTRTQRQLLDQFASQGVKTRHGRMYEVAINADPASLLDWDKPLSQQSAEVQTRVQPLVEYLKTRPLRPDVMDKLTSGQMKGHELYKWLAREKSFDEARITWPNVPKRHNEHASRALLEHGVPGLQYLDAGSRPGGVGTHNYVVFDDKLVSILKKYGVALPVIDALRRQADWQGGRLTPDQIATTTQQ